jgi:hypothetical protein
MDESHPEDCSSNRPETALTMTPRCPVLRKRPTVASGFKFKKNYCYSYWRFRSLLLILHVLV